MFPQDGPPPTQDGRPIRVDTILDKDVLLLEQFSVEEGISQPFSLRLLMLSASPSLSLDQLLQSGMTVTLELSAGQSRYFHGLVREIEQGEMRQNLTSYTAEIVPWFWFLNLTSNCRIYQQNSTVREIIEDVFKRSGFDASGSWRFQLFNDHPPREYCVQYRETDFHFVSRLMEEEGIFYYFVHEQDKHTLVITDDNAGFTPVDDPDVRYHQSDAGIDDPNVVSEINLGQSVTSTAVTLTDYDFEKPSVELGVTESSGAYELYDYPGLYKQTSAGRDLAKYRLQAAQNQKSRISGFGTHREFTSGYTFDLIDHPRGDANQKYALVSVQHTAGPNGYRSSEDTGAHYTNHFQAIPRSLPYRTVPQHPKPFVKGVQTAVVVGTPGEEFEVDKYGCVKVQFFWDREGKMDGKDSCWLRVSQSWAGKGWGGVSLPRIGQEVIVDFLEGDPDRPIITGRVYNGDQMPPYALPSQQTKTVFKTNSSKGGGGFNEIRLEDAKGSEQIFIHAEKDHETRIKNDLVETVGNQFHQHVVKNMFIKVDADRHETIKGDHNEKVDGTISRQAGQNVEEKAGNNYAMAAGMEVHIKAGMTAVIEAGTSLTLKVGSNFININPGGVFISGSMVMINSGGSPGSGSGSSPQPPVSPREAVDANAGQNNQAPVKTAPPPRPNIMSPAAQALLNAHISAAPYCEVCSRGA